MQLITHNLVIIFFILFNNTSIKSIDQQILGVIEIDLNLVSTPVTFREYDLHDLTYNYDSLISQEIFGSYTNKRVNDTPAEVDYFYDFDGFETVVVQLYEKPQLASLLISDPKKYIKVGNLKLQAGLTIEDLALPLQEFAKANNTLPEFGEISNADLTRVSEGDTKIRVLYDLQTELIQKIIFINSVL